jgi:hypothetical protein
MPDGRPVRVQARKQQEEEEEEGHGGGGRSGGGGGARVRFDVSGGRGGRGGGGGGGGGGRRDSDDDSDDDDDKSFGGGSAGGEDGVRLVDGFVRPSDAAADEADAAALRRFMAPDAGTRMSLADIIMAKMCVGLRGGARAHWCYCGDLYGGWLRLRRL